ncbi:PIR protein CIR protein [Plasmodium vinckei vinckei]|uniref:PIR protein CIR protein n=1 Tax=Plasmodium vinckei vinckei TaxID=54757 RepID=A0A449BLS2_PLAVN|nr:PIR protein CIR protein [Plasmodium vinckei vinckei]VEV54391.1 PIR protein CIR protein [Plasmodium vinckei vinckei]
MAQPSYDLKKVYKEIFTISNYCVESKGQLTVNSNHKSIHDYCNSWRNSGKGNCDCYFQLASCGFIYLLENLKKYGLDDDKLAEYAILWLSYKLNTAPENCDMNLNNFYTKYIETNNHYNNIINGDDNMNYKKIIDKIKVLIDIKEISKFNDIFYTLFFSYFVIDYNDFKCENYLEFANKFVQYFQKLNNDSNNIKDSLFSQILSTLSNDYDNLKNIYGNKSCKISSIPKLNPKSPVENSGKGDKQILGETSESTSSSLSILKTVIPGLSTFFVIPVFLGVAYKYSLFGIDKLFQRQYIRNKLKKTKKKMELNI